MYHGHLCFFDTLSLIAKFWAWFWKNIIQTFCRAEYCAWQSGYPYSFVFSFFNIPTIHTTPLSRSVWWRLCVGQLHHITIHFIFPLPVIVPFTVIFVRQLFNFFSNSIYCYKPWTWRQISLNLNWLYYLQLILSSYSIYKVPQYNKLRLSQLLIK